MHDHYFCVLMNINFCVMKTIIIIIQTTLLHCKVKKEFVLVHYLKKYLTGGPGESSPSGLANDSVRSTYSLSAEGLISCNMLQCDMDKTQCTVSGVRMII